MAPPASTAHALARVEEQIQRLTTAVQALVPQQEDYKNLILISQLGFKIEIPEFYGEQSAEEILDWMVTVEETLEFGRVPSNRTVPMVAMRFRGRAAAWWWELKASRESLGKPRILSWDKLKKKMCREFLPLIYDQEMLERLHRLLQGHRSIEEYYTKFCSLLARVHLQESDQQIVARFVGGLGQEIRHYLNLLNPLTLAQAHQLALALEVEKKKKGNLGIISYEIVGSCALGFFATLGLLHTLFG